VRDFAAVKDAVATIERKVGPIAVLVNNAGINRNRMMHRMSEEEWDEVVAVDLNGPVNVMRPVGP
jgi:acetoacetyl-CoA reductase